MIKITADSTCDLSPDILQDLDITLVPLHIVVDDKVYSDGIDITPADLFRLVEEEGKTVKTAAVNAYEYQAVFEQFAPNYDAVIHINISSEFSSCYQNAVLAAQNFSNVFVVDSRNLSTGSGSLVYEAAKMAKEGVQAEEIIRRLKERVPRVNISFVIHKLDYLYKGGRCSGLELFGASLLKIKPTIEVVGGNMQVGKKYRGSFERCLVQYVKDRLSGSAGIDTRRAFITYSTCPEETLENVKKTVKECGGFQEIIVTRAGCTISSHCGPNTLGIAFWLKDSAL